MWFVFIDIFFFLCFKDWKIKYKILVKIVFGFFFFNLEVIFFFCGFFKNISVIKMNNIIIIGVRRKKNFFRMLGFNVVLVSYKEVVRFRNFVDK